MTLSHIALGQFEQEQTYTESALRKEAGAGGPDRWEDTVSRWDRPRCEPLQYVGGHLRYGVHEYFPQPMEYVSMMRDPVERIVSDYYYIRRDVGHTLHDWVHEHTSSVLEYVERRLDSPYWKGVKDQQARRLAGFEGSKERDPQVLVEAAKENIRCDFSVVGTTERFDESLLLMQDIYDWQHVFYRRRNKTGSRPTAEDLDVQTRRRIQDITVADRALYDWVSDRLDRQLDGRISPVDVARFQRRNRIYSTYRWIRSRVAHVYRRVSGK